MTRAELSAILADLVRRKAITLADARATLDRFDAGELEDLPVAAPAQEDNRWVLALALVLFMMKGKTTRPLSTNERQRAQKLLRLRYEGNVAQLAATVAQGGSVGQWQQDMKTTIADYARQMAVAGAGTLPKASIQAAVDGQIATQWPYLTGFATQVLARKQGDRPMGNLWITQRSRLYGGAGWASFFHAQGSVALPGWCDVWVSREDPFVCRLCSPRHQTYFIPGQGVMPGDVGACLGDCRCLRIPEYVPDIYAALLSGRSEQIHPVKQRIDERMARDERARVKREKAR